MKLLKQLTALILFLLPITGFSQDNMDDINVVDNLEVLQPTGAIVIDADVYSVKFVPSLTIIKSYGVDALDEMPIFSEQCMDKKNRSECDQEALKTYIDENLEFPREALKKGQEGKAYVYFTIDEKGFIQNDLEVVVEDSPCAGCKKAALKFVENMPKWAQPGKINGKPVNTEITLPIRFDVF